MSETIATFGNVELSSYAGPATTDGTTRRRVQITTPEGQLQLSIQQWRWLHAIAWAVSDDARPLGVTKDGIRSGPLAYREGRK